METFFISTPFGQLEGLIENDCLSRLSFSGLCKQHMKISSHPVALSTRRWFEAYLDKQLLPIPQIQPAGTLYQQKIWEILKSIPAGKTCSYGQLAELYKQKNNINKMCCRAVGTAVAKNPIVIIIPCHRVIRADGSIGRYSAGKGETTKSMLLEFEKGFPQ